MWWESNTSLQLKEHNRKGMQNYERRPPTKNNWCTTITNINYNLKPIKRLLMAILTRQIITHSMTFLANRNTNYKSTNVWL